MLATFPSHASTSLPPIPASSSSSPSFTDGAAPDMIGDFAAFLASAEPMRRCAACEPALASDVALQDEFPAPDGERVGEDDDDEPVLAPAPLWFALMPAPPPLPMPVGAAAEAVVPTPPSDAVPNESQPVPASTAQSDSTAPSDAAATTEFPAAPNGEKAAAHGPESVPAKQSAQIAGSSAASLQIERSNSAGEQKNTSDNYAKQGEAYSLIRGGTGKAKESEHMAPSPSLSLAAPSSAAPVSPVASVVVSAPVAQAPTSAPALAPVPSATLTPESAAVRLLERVAEAAEVVRANSPEEVVVRIDLPDTVKSERVDVRVTLREGRVHADFRCESPAIRAALVSAWEGFVRGGESAGSRWAEPVFGASPTGSESDFARGGFGEQRQPARQPAETAAPASTLSRAFSRSLSAATAVASSPLATVTTDRARHLSVLA